MWTKEDAKKWRIKNKQSIKEYNKQYRLKNKRCIKKYHNQYYFKNVDKLKKKASEYYHLHREYRAKKDKQYYIKRKAYILKHKDKYREENKAKVLLSFKKWYAKNKDTYNEKQRNRMKSDILFKLSHRMSSEVSHSVKAKKCGKSWRNLYTVQELKEHLEKQFTNSMTWDNYGTYWEIDHIIPKSYFKYKSCDDIEFLKCWCLSNLRPLEALINRKKKDKLEFVDHKFK